MQKGSSERILEGMQEVYRQPDDDCHEEEEDETIFGTGTSHGNGDSSENQSGKSECFTSLFTIIERKDKDSEQ